MLQSHGFPKVMGVLTHLDLFNKQAQLKKTKKLLKKRFWSEVYDGAKLFYLSGMIHGKYLKRDIKNLVCFFHDSLLSNKKHQARYISIQRFRPLVWRNSHPYVLVDRIEDITHPEIIRTNPKVDREVVLFGYLHGTHLKSSTKVNFLKNNIKLK